MASAASRTASGSANTEPAKPAYSVRKSSGNKALDEAIERAIKKSDPLPLPDQPNLFERVLELKYKPFNE